MKIANDASPILKSSCFGYHSGLFSSLATLLNAQAGDDYGYSLNANMPWFTLGEPATSYMYLKIQGTAAYDPQMPRLQTPLGNSEQVIIEQWIVQGAQ